ncbi:MAG: hypothetical protein ACOYJA_03665 [Christensenellales bacterium]|jgi:hypothetical protein
MEQTHSTLAVFAVDGWRPGRAWGRLWTPGRPAQALEDYGALLLALAAPPAPAPRAAPGSPDLAPGRTATFTVQIGFRQHDSCQGWLRRADGGVRPFRSALHLLLLLERSLAQPSSESEGPP